MATLNLTLLAAMDANTEAVKALTVAILGQATNAASRARGRRVGSPSPDAPSPSLSCSSSPNPLNPLPLPAQPSAAPSAHTAFVEWWHTAYREASGQTYPFAPKDGAAVKRMLKTAEPEALRLAAGRFIERWRTDPWWSDKGLSLSLLQSSLAQLLSAKQAKAGVPGVRIDFREPAHRADTPEDTAKRHDAADAEFERMKAAERSGEERYE